MGRVTTGPFFLAERFSNVTPTFKVRSNSSMTSAMAWQDTVEQTITGLGFDLVDLERSAGGLLRVTIDWPWEAGADEGNARFVTVEDCERVTRQLQYLLEVENVDYRRLEVGSPGIDRPLRKEADYMRFEGQVVDITLKAPIGVTGSSVAANRKKFRGTLERVGEGEQWQIVWSDEPERKPGQRVSKKRAPAPLQALGFLLSDVQQARLAPIVNFKGRGKASETGSGEGGDAASNA
jgi:ribosome maturation factor RimP